MFQNPDHSDILFVSGAVQSKREDSQREDSCRTINRKEGEIRSWRLHWRVEVAIISSISFKVQLQFQNHKKRGRGEYEATIARGGGND